MTVKEIMADWLVANGYDGLVNTDAECGCVLADLWPCCEEWGECEPGFKGPDPTGEADWLIYRTREAADKAREVAQEAAKDEMASKTPRRLPAN